MTKTYKEELEDAADKYTKETCINIRVAQFAKLDFLAGASWERERTKVLVEALEKIIKMSKQEAIDRYGDESKSDNWGCPVTASKALATYQGAE